MNPIRDARLKLRRELEAPPALRKFGTHHMPADGRWPGGYGIGGHPVPKGYWKQFLHPFRRGG